MSTLQTDILGLLRRRQYINRPLKSTDVLVVGFEQEANITGISSPVPFGNVNLLKFSDLINNVLAYISTGGLAGTQYVFVMADGTDAENAIELQAAYDTAKTMSPTINNRITVIAAPGDYDFGSNPFVMDTAFIDLVSLDGNKSVIFNSLDPNGTISITANTVFVKGINVLNKNFTVSAGLNMLVVENCEGGNYSFGGSTINSNVFGTYINCIGGDYSFGGADNDSAVYGTYINCQGGDLSFGGASNISYVSAIFTNCVGAVYSFGGSGAGIGSVSGFFNNCIGSDYSFAGNGGDASGEFNNCVAGLSSFGGVFGTASGIFTNCKGGDEAFAGIGTASGTFTNCQASFYSFAAGSTASGIFTNCLGGEFSFGGNAGILSGKLYYCRLTVGTFATVSGGGRTVYCIDGTDTPNNQ